MIKNHLTALLFSLIFSSSICSAQEQVLYKKIDTTYLFLEVYKPPHFDTSKKYPALIFFFGGGWNGGSRSQFLEHAKYFSKRGLVCFLADYRTASKNKTTPFAALEDANSAMRFVRKSAKKFGVDPDKIIASGGSAGGHLAAATALTKEYNAPTDDLSIDCIPNALVLFNPVIDNGPGGYGYERIGNAYKSFSPLHNIEKGAPPTIVFLGTEDALIPVVTAQYYQTVMEKVGSTCKLELYEGQSHGFFNYRNRAYFNKTVLAADAFLQELGYLTETPKVNIN
ncbi:alpha/beta hydrolase [uncultured Kriegella sp.]|uniref:alpha/beta hydrolase n=1 Tax=uncultured Kriegella sp. TaxID=1798910 RepID=UPI0030DCC105|tara:strand:+ start:307084 stop:307929 length:846 start_codon:yes stop_codon:yes gene_type:complete